MDKNHFTVCTCKLFSARREIPHPLPCFFIFSAFVNKAEKCKGNAEDTESVILTEHRSAVPFVTQKCCLCRRRRPEGPERAVRLRRCTKYYKH